MVGIPLAQVRAMENLIITVIFIQVSIDVPRRFSHLSVTPSLPYGDFQGKSGRFWEPMLSPSGFCDTVVHKPLTDAILALMSASAERHVENCYFGPIKH